MINIKSGVNFEVAFAWKKTDGTADTGLSPTLTMYKLSNNTKELDAIAMTEVALGIYKYDIATAKLVSGETYAIQVDGTASADDSSLRYQYMFIAVDYGSTKGIADNISDILTDTGTTLDGKIDTIDTNLDSVKSTVDTNLDQQVSKTGMGTGTLSLPVQYLKTGTTTPWAGVQGWLTTDASGNTIYGSKLNRTNDNGVIEFWVEAGTYYFWTNQESSYVSKHVVDSNGNITTTD